MKLKINFLSLLALASLLSLSALGMEPVKHEPSFMEVLPSEIKLKVVQQLFKDELGKENTNLNSITKCINQVRLVNREFKDVVADSSNFKLLANKFTEIAPIVLAHTFHHAMPQASAEIIDPITKQAQDQIKDRTKAYFQAAAKLRRNNKGLDFRLIDAIDSLKIVDILQVPNKRDSIILALQENPTSYYLRLLRHIDNQIETTKNLGIFYTGTISSMPTYARLHTITSPFKFGNRSYTKERLAVIVKFFDVNDNDKEIPFSDVLEAPVAVAIRPNIFNAYSFNFNSFDDMHMRFATEASLIQDNIKLYKRFGDLPQTSAAPAISEPECGICQEKINAEDFPEKITCGHHNQFHAACLAQWKEHKPTCPLCRTAL